jgi:hypothetical protein
VEAIMRYFRAAWSPVLIASAVTLPLLFAAIIVAAMVFHFWILAIIPTAILAGTLPFAIRGYSVADGILVVHHPFSRTRIALSDLMTAHLVPNATEGSVRTSGMDGLFATSGWFRNDSLGDYRAYLTHTGRTIVLTFPKQTIVLSPYDPEGFLVALKQPLADPDQIPNT